MNDDQRAGAVGALIKACDQIDRRYFMRKEYPTHDDIARMKIALDEARVAMSQPKPVESRASDKREGEDAADDSRGVLFCGYTTTVGEIKASREAMRQDLEKAEAELAEAKEDARVKSVEADDLGEQLEALIEAAIGSERQGDATEAAYKAINRMRDGLAELRQPKPAGGAAPLSMILPCPRCREMHVDAPEPEKGWTNPPHKSHLCHYCGLVWRPADVPTNGVASIATIGKDDNWKPGDKPAGEAGGWEDAMRWCREEAARIADKFPEEVGPALIEAAINMRFPHDRKPPEPKTGEDKP